MERYYWMELTISDKFSSRTSTYYFQPSSRCTEESLHYYTSPTYCGFGTVLMHEIPILIQLRIMKVFPPPG